MTTARSRAVRPMRPLLLALAAAALALVGCSPSTLLTLNVEAAQFLSEDDATIAIPVPTPTDASGLPAPIEEFIPDSEGFSLTDLGLTGDLVGGLERLGFTIGLDLTSALDAADADASGTISLGISVFVAAAGQTVDDGVQIATDSVSLGTDDTGALTLEVALSSTDNAAAYDIIAAGNAVLGVKIDLESTAVTPSAINNVSVTAVLETVDLSITTSASAVVGL